MNSKVLHKLIKQRFEIRKRKCMNISLVAQIKKYDDFFQCYNEGDEKRLYKNESLLFYSLSNNDIESRYIISKFLLDRCSDVNVINEEGEGLLHILLSRTNHDIKQTIELCRKILEKGGNINQLDNKNRVPLQYIIIMKYTDEELEPLYELWFSQENILNSQKNAWGKTPLEIAEKIPYRMHLVERIRNNAKCY